MTKRKRTIVSSSLDVTNTSHGYVSSSSHGHGGSSVGGSNSQSEHDNSTETSTRHKTRGTTMCREKWCIANPEKRIILQLNSENQLVGQTSTKLASACGVVARMAHLCPITYNDWRLLTKDFEEQIMSYMRERFIITSDMVEKCILQTIGHSWGSYKTNLRKSHIYSENEDGSTKTKAQILANIPSGVQRLQWIQFVNYWLTEDAKKISKKHKEIREKQTVLHKTGSKSYARKRHEMEKEKNRKIGAIEFYLATHKGEDKDGKEGKMEDIAKDVYDKCNALLSERCPTQDTEDVMSSTDRRYLESEILQEVQGAEHPGRVRGAGRGPTPFTWSDFKRSDLSGEVERLEARIQVLIKRDAERDLQMKRMEQMMEELMRGRSLR